MSPMDGSGSREPGNEITKVRYVKSGVILPIYKVGLVYRTDVVPTKARSE